MSNQVRVIEALEGQLITQEIKKDIKNLSENLQSMVEDDVLKLVVVNRYQASKPAVAFVKNFGLKSGAIASSVAHDSHNIIAVGVSDEEIVRAVNLIIDKQGGVSYSNALENLVLPLPVAGLMSNQDGYKVAKEYEMLDCKAKESGARLAAPYMTLSFLALLVIPELKLSDKGLFDGKAFGFTSLFV